MEAVLDVSKGMHVDYPIVSQPEGTYRLMLNGIRLLSGGVEKEAGTLNIPAFTERNKTILGSFVLDRDVIILSKSDDEDEIGVLDETDSYTIIKTGDFNFSYSNQISVEGKVRFNGHRVIYFVDGINPMRRVDLDDSELIASPTFLEDIKLQLNSKRAKVSLNSVTNDGNVKTGIYQFAVASITSTGNKTPYGFLSPLISIVDESYNGNWDIVDGALPQTNSNKSIKLDVTDLDTAFPYAEIIVVTYEGLDNIQKAYSIGTFQVTGDIKSFTYKGQDQHGAEVDVSDIVVKPVVYDTGSVLSQKDNRLVISNLTASTESTNFQAFANKIILRPVIEEIDLLPGYKDPSLIAEKKGYMRGEVYSFAIAPIFKTSQNTIAYHIPASFDVDWELVRELDNERRIKYVFPDTLGTYTSDEEYPSSSDYPIIDNTSSLFNGSYNKVRHHVMPTLATEPLTNEDGTKLRILGISVDFTEALGVLTDSQRANLLGFTVIRQLRAGNDKSILTQGIAKPHVQGDSKLFPSPFNGVVNTDVVDGATDHWNAAGFYTSRLEMIAFYSAESTIYASDFTTATKLSLVGYLHGKGSIAAFKLSDSCGGIGEGCYNVDPEAFGSSELTVSRFSYTIQDNNLNGFTIATGAPLTVDINTDTISYIGPGPDTTSNPNVTDGQYAVPNASGITINRLFNNGYLFMQTPVNSPFLTKTYDASGVFGGAFEKVPQWLYKGNGTGGNDDLIVEGTRILSSSFGTVITAQGTNRDVTVGLYNLSRTLSSQYGPITDAKYIIVGNVLLENTDTITTMFGGDTFVGRIALMTQEGQNQINGGDDFLVSHREMHYFICESSINTGYRHYNSAIGTEGQSDFTPGTIPYYPKVTNVWSSDGSGILNLNVSLGHATGYNKQYSFENNIQYFYPKQFLEEVVTDYSNRSIYSEQSIEGEQIDMFRIFLPNNYHDLPKDKGVITNSFVFRNTLYLHTTGSLWKTFFNENVALASTEGFVNLGNGGVFSRPSIPLQTVNGGFAGTQGKWGISTPWGYYFPDARQRKWFQLTEGLDDLTLQGMESFFNDNMSEDGDYSMTFDYLHNRVLMTRKGQWTLSYQVLLKSWTSKHTYLGDHYIQRAKENYVFSNQGNRLHKLNVGPYGNYLDVNSDFRLEYVVNIKADTGKVFDNQEVFSETVDSAGAEYPYETISTFNLNTSGMSTGECTITVPTTYIAARARPIPGVLKAAKAEGAFRLSIPNNRLTSTGLSNQLYPESRMKGTYGYFTITHNGLDKKIIIHTIKTLFRVNAG